MSKAGIIGLGCVTGYGWGRDALWQGLLTGKSAAQLLQGFGTDGSDGWVVRIPGGGREDDGPGRYSRALRWAAREAIEDAKSRGWVPGRRVGLVHALVLGDLELHHVIGSDQSSQTMPSDFLGALQSTPISRLMQEYGFRGRVMGVSAMCTSGNAALLTAKEWLDAGKVDDVIVVATDLTCEPRPVESFRNLGVAITDVEPRVACRPFQPSSRGFVFGEASIGFVLSGGAGSSYGQLLGGAMSHDAHHITHIDPDLVSITACFEEALADAGVDPKDVAYLNAHGPGTKQCDAAEAAMLERFFLPSTGIYSVKPLAGHCQGAAAAVEVAAMLLANRYGVIPAPVIADPIGAHPQLLDGPTPVSPGLTVKSSIGLGGQCAVTVFGPGS